MKYGTVLSIQHDLEEVVNHWASILPDLEVVSVLRHNEATGGQIGAALAVDFRLGTQTMSLLQGPVSYTHLTLPTTPYV